MSTGVHQNLIKTFSSTSLSFRYSHSAVVSRVPVLKRLWWSVSNIADCRCSVNSLEIPMVESFFKYSCRLVILRLCTLFMRIVPFRVSLSVLGTVTKPLISGLFCAYKTLQNKIWVDGPSVKGVAALTDMKMFFRKVFWVCIVINFCVRQITDYKFNSNFLPVSGYSFLLPIFKLCLVNFSLFIL